MITHFGLQPGTKEVVGFTENLVKFINVVKNETGLVIALNFYGDYFLNYYEDSKVPCKL